MHRSWWTRAVAAMLAAWFAIAVIEPAALHVCPVHDGALGAHAVHHAAGHVDHASGHGAPAPSSSRQCTCLGDCVGAAGAALPAVMPRLHVPAVVAAASGIHRTDAGFGPSAPGLLLPFANGPPSAALLV
jgi:hypothetical protein